VHCHICDHHTESFVDEKTQVLYYRCPECECLFKDPVHYHSLDMQKARYDLHRNDEEDEGYRAYFQRFLDFVLPHVSGVEKALDFGCGKSTLLANILNNINIECDAYDPLYHPIKLSDSKKYDIIVSTEVFEHLHDPRGVFSQLVSMLKEGGYLAIQTAFHPNDIASFKQWYYHKDPTHIVFFRPKTFEVLSRLYGCRLCAHNGKHIVVIRKDQSDLPARKPPAKDHCRL